MEYNRVDEKTLIKLPKQNVDTGMGLERTITVLQGKTSVYMTEIFQPVIQAIENLAGITYGNDPEKDKSIRIITDHARSSVFILGDPKGVTPSNVGAGYAAISCPSSEYKYSM